MAAKKVLLFLVEGPSEEFALQGVLAGLLNNEQVKFHIIAADVTTQERCDATSVKTLVSNQVRNFMTRYRLTRQHMLGVVHLMDTDGAFVPESAIVEDASLDHFEYTESTIAAASRQKVIERNATKSKNMLLLSRTSTTYQKIPYEAYYFSRNLEHALHGISEERTAPEKIRLSDLFHDKYADAPEEFLSFISTTPPAVPHSEYKASWDYISEQNQLHSLQRGCNLHILLNRLLNVPSGSVPNLLQA